MIMLASCSTRAMEMEEAGMVVSAMHEDEWHHHELGGDRGEVSYWQMMAEQGTEINSVDPTDVESLEDVWFVNACCMGEHKEADMIKELDGQNWMALGVVETWRAEETQEYITEEAHLVMAAGDKVERAGVAIIVNKKWTEMVVDWQAVSGRLIWADS